MKNTILLFLKYIITSKWTSIVSAVMPSK